MSSGLIDYLPLTLCDSQNRQSVKVTGYTSFDYVERWGERDSFTLTISRESQFAPELLVGRIMILPADDYHTDMRACVIKQIRINDDTITISGNDYLWELFACRVATYNTIIYPGKDTQSGTAETVARHYLNVNCLEASDISRGDPFCSFEPERATPLGNSVSIEGRYQSLLEIMESICTQGDINIYGSVVEDSSERGWHIVIHFAVGTDHSQTSTIPDDNWVVLSEEYGNARLTEFSQTVPDGNVITVGGSGSGYDRLTGTYGDQTLTGISRREMFVDASDCWNQGLVDAKGQESLDNAKHLSVEMSLINRNIYGRDFVLGDVVSVDAGIYGAYNLRVSEVDTNYSSDAVTVSVHLGAEQKGIVRVIRDAVQGIPLRRQ